MFVQGHPTLSSHVLGNTVTGNTCASLLSQKCSIYAGSLNVKPGVISEKMTVRLLVTGCFGSPAMLLECTGGEVPERGSRGVLPRPGLCGGFGGGLVVLRGRIEVDLWYPTWLFDVVWRKHCLDGSIVQSLAFRRARARAMTTVQEKKIRKSRRRTKVTGTRRTRRTEAKEQDHKNSRSKNNQLLH